MCAGSLTAGTSSTSRSPPEHEFETDRMDVDDYYQQSKRWWLRVHEKGGTHHEVPAHHTAEEYLDAYIESAGIAGEKDTPLWRSMTKERRYGGNRMSRVDVFR